MLSYFNQWGSLGPLMIKTTSTLHGDTRCVRTSSCSKCILNLEFLRELWFSLNFKYNIHKCEVKCNAFTVVWFSFSSVFLLASSFWMLFFACLQFVLYVHVLYFLNSVLMLSMVEFGAMERLLEVELPPGSGVYWNCSTECCQFYWIPPFPGGCCIGNQCCPEAKWCTGVFSIFLETGCWLWAVCWPHSMPPTCNR